MKPWPDGSVSVSFKAQGAVSNIVATLQQAATQFRLQFPGYTFSDLTPIYRIDAQGNLEITIVTTALPPAA